MDYGLYLHDWQHPTYGVMANPCDEVVAGNCETTQYGYESSGVCHKGEWANAICPAIGPGGTGTVIQTGTVFKIQIVGSSVEYSLNDIVFRTVTPAGGILYPLHVFVASWGWDGVKDGELLWLH